MEHLSNSAYKSLMYLIQIEKRDFTLLNKRKPFLWMGRGRRQYLEDNILKTKIQIFKVAVPPF